MLFFDVLFVLLPYQDPKIIALLPIWRQTADVYPYKRAEVGLYCCESADRNSCRPGVSVNHYIQSHALRSLLYCIFQRQTTGHLFVHINIRFQFNVLSFHCFRVSTEHTEFNHF